MNELDFGEKVAGFITAMVVYFFAIYLSREKGRELDGILFILVTILLILLRIEGLLH